MYCDHKNLTYKNFNTERVMRWRLLIEEFGADLTYIKGENNIVADALSRLDLIPSSEQESFHHGTLLQLFTGDTICLLYTSPSPRDGATSRMPSSA